MPKLETLLEMLKADPKDSFVRYAIGMEYLKQQRFADAITEFSTLLAHDPNYVAAYFMSARAHQQKGDIPAAKSLYQQGIAVAQKVGDAKAAREMTDALNLLG